MASTTKATTRCATPGCRGIPRQSQALGRDTHCQRCAWAQHDAALAAETARREREWPTCTECSAKVDVDRFPGDAQCSRPCRRAAAKRAEAMATKRTRYYDDCECPLCEPGSDAAKRGANLKRERTCDNCGLLMLGCSEHSHRGDGGEWYCDVNCRDEGESRNEEGA